MEDFKPQPQTQAKIENPEEPKLGHCVMLFGVACLFVLGFMLIMPR